MATYTKLRSGDWGIRCTSKVTEGQTVTVTKRDGSSKTETVAKVVWSGNGVWLCAIGQRTESAARHGSYATIGARTQARMDRTGWTGCACGSIEGHPRPSDCWTCRHDSE